MYKIRIAIADYDSSYLEKLNDYLSSIVYQKLIVVSFTDCYLFKKYCVIGNYPDVFLISPDFICEEIKKAVNSTVLLLTEGDPDTQYEGYDSVSKYQPGDMIMARVMEAHTDKQKLSGKPVDVSGGTTVITVYSPCGGTGKTSLSINIASYWGLLGKEVFLLNLELAGSHTAFLEAPGDKCFSHVLLNVKDRVELLPLRVDTNTVRDARYSINFFQPPESGEEFSELDNGGLEFLLGALKQLGRYDLIVVDTDSVLNERNITLLGQSDKVVMLLVQDYVCKLKTVRMMKELEKNSVQNIDSFIPVLNKYRPELVCNNSIKAGFVIPMLDEVIVCSQKNRPVFTRIFTRHAFKLAGQLME